MAGGAYRLWQATENQLDGGWPTTWYYVPPRKLWAWGNNSNGELGQGDIVNRSSPTQIGTSIDWALYSTNGGSIAQHSSKVKIDGTLWVWGKNNLLQAGITSSTPAQLGALTNWSITSLGAFHTSAIKADGTLWGWGGGSSGQIGDGFSNNARFSPVQVSSLTNWLDVSSGYSHTLALKTDGTLWAWGSNSDGQVGDSTIVNKGTPTQIGLLNTWSKIGTGARHSLAIKTDGTLWAWGNGTKGALGNDSATNRSSPVQVGTLTNWLKACGGLYYTLALKTDGTIWTWGGGYTNAADGQLGTGSTTNTSSPVQVGALTNWLSVSAGSYNALAIKTTGTLWAWGNNAYGQLGDNTITNRLSPIQVGSLTNWLQVTGGYRHTIAISS